MVSLTAVRESNKTLKTSNPNPVAVFVGATSGIGEFTAQAFAASTTRPTVYIVGRNQASAKRIIDEMKQSNPDGTYRFIRTEVSLIKSVDIACEEIKQKEEKVDYLCMSQGYLSFGGRVDTAEGVEELLALRYYTRLRFVTVLTPLLLNAPSPRVLSILYAGSEGPMVEDDLGLTSHFSFTLLATHGTTLTCFAMEQLASTHPSISFVHSYPGFVKSGIFEAGAGGASGGGFSPLTSFIFRWLLLPLFSPLAVSPAESGERHLFELTSARYPSAAAKGAGGKGAGVPVPAGMEVSKGSNFEAGSGVYLLGWNGEVVGKEKFLREYREKGMPRIVWEHTTSVFNRVLSSASQQ